MGYRSSRGSSRNTDTDRSPDHTPSIDSTAETASPDWSQRMTLDQAEAEFGMAVPDERTMHRLQRLEAGNPHRFPDWVAEGMPVDVMGDPQAIEAFRQRQAERPAAVPTDIERQNNRSVQRSEKAAAETEPAGETGVPDSVREVISSSGRSLDASIQRAMEERMGDSLGDVRIHTGAQAASACESINARAFTVGNHIAFNAGEYDPESPEGQHVLAHELAHVRQQTGGAVSMLPQEDVALEVDPDPALEREAEETAQRVMEGGELGIQRLAETEVHVQRMSGVERETTYSPGAQAGGGKVNTDGDQPSPAVAQANLGEEHIAEFQKAVVEDIQTLYQKVQEQGVLAKMADASAGEALKMGATELGKQSGVPFGQAIGSLAGSAREAIYNNREKVLEILELKSESVVNTESETGSGNSQGGSLGK
jgi:hypothetical protein